MPMFNAQGDMLTLTFSPEGSSASSVVVANDVSELPTPTSPTIALVLTPTPAIYYTDGTVWNPIPGQIVFALELPTEAYANTVCVVVNANGTFVSLNYTLNGTTWEEIPMGGADLTEINQAITDIEEQLGVQQEDIAALQEQQQAITDIEEQLRVQQEDIAALQEQQQTNTENIATNTEDIATINETLANLDTVLSAIVVSQNLTLTEPDGGGA